MMPDRDPSVSKILKHKPEDPKPNALLVLAAGVPNSPVLAVVFWPNNPPVLLGVEPKSVT